MGGGLFSALLAHMDADGDQQITPDEFAAAVSRPVRDRPRFDAAVSAAARSLIRAADHDGRDVLGLARARPEPGYGCRVTGRTRVELGRRGDLGADCANCFGLCCVALAFAKSADFPFNKPAGDPCANLDAQDACRIHPQLRDRGFKGCTVFDCFGAGQKVSRHTFQGRSWREDPETRTAMFSAFPVVRRLHELLWYLDEAIALVEPSRDAAPWLQAFEHVRQLSDRSAGELASLDVDAEYDAVRDLLTEASEIARAAVRQATGRRGGRDPGPGSDLTGARLAGADLRGITIRGSIAIAADLSGALLRRCDVLGVDMRDADLSGADLRGAIYLTQMQVNSARGNARTVLPEGFERPPPWTGLAAGQRRPAASRTGRP